MNQQPMISISIPVKPHVKKYMSFRYGNEHTFSKNSLIGILLIHVLDKKVPKSNFVFKDYKENYPILISEQYYYRHGCEIPLKKRRYLALCLEKIFTEDLHLFIDFGMSEFSLSAAECIRKFFKKYEITENEVKYESVYRSFQRYKSENNLKKTNN